MAATLAIDKQKTLLLAMDYQNQMMDSVPQKELVLKAARSALDGARKAGLPVWFVRHGGGQLAEGGPSSEFHPALAPVDGERVLTKLRTGPFSSTPLDLLLREKGITTLLLMGVATGGCVISAMRWASDIGYQCVVIRDACDDREPEVHRVLMDKLFPRHGKVVSSSELLAALA